MISSQKKGGTAAPSQGGGGRQHCTKGGGEENSNSQKEEEARAAPQKEGREGSTTQEGNIAPHQRKIGTQDQPQKHMGWCGRVVEERVGGMNWWEWCGMVERVGGSTKS